MIKLKDYLKNLYVEVSDLMLWHISKNILNYPSFLTEPVSTKAMATPAIDCPFCKKEQERTNKKKMFCRRHLMLYELRKYYLSDDVKYFLYKDLLIFPSKYSLRYFNTLVIGAFTSKRIEDVEKEYYYMLKFSFLKTQLPLIKNPEVFDITELSKEDEILVELEDFSYKLKKENDNFILNR